MCLQNQQLNFGFIKEARRDKYNHSKVYETKQIRGWHVLIVQTGQISRQDPQITKKARPS